MAKLRSYDRITEKLYITVKTTEKRFKNGDILTMTISPYYNGHMSVIPNNLFYNIDAWSSCYDKRLTIEVLVLNHILDGLHG